ncbi:hypothetical protein D3C83_55590 [compost metagenome]
MLRVGHAYEQATSWRNRRPSLVPGARAAELDAGAGHEPPPAIPAETRRLVEMLLERAGLKLPERIVLQLCEAAPYALAMAQRLPMHAWEDEPMNVFAFPASQRTTVRQPAR